VLLDRPVAATRPSAVTITFDGLMSRCSLPAPWIAAAPSTSWRSADCSRCTSHSHDSGRRTLTLLGGWTAPAGE
jgi:hypothetical protein